jgi:uncharacterized protein
MKITTDTNVLLSATFWNGDSYRIIERVEEGKIDLILSREIIEEFGGLLEYDEIKDKIKDKDLEMKRSVDELIEMSTIVEPRERFNVVEEDPEDNVFIDCAVEGEVDYLVSKDNHLLKLKDFKGIKIVTPKEMMEIFQ